MTKTRIRLRGPASGLSEDERGRIARIVDGWFFAFGTVSAVFLAYVLFTEAFARGWAQAWFILVIYLVIAYLILPRVHTVLSRVYLPDYFIGRTRTREGILGDPVNLGLRGSEEQIHAAMHAAGWTLADDLGLRANLRIVTSTLTRRSYPEAPVSSLYLFGHPQAFCYQQEVDGSPGKRHHVRFWPTPPGWLLPGGYQADWLAAGTYDRSVGISVFTLQVTHRIADDVDDERDHIVSSVGGAGVGASTTVIDNFSTGYHSRNGGGDAIVTDGDLPIIDVSSVVVPDEATLPPADAPPTRSLVRAGDPRPFDTTVAVVLMVVASLSSILSGFLLVGGWKQLTDDALATATTDDDVVLIPWVVGGVIVLSLLVTLSYLVLAWRVRRGGNLARLLAMAFSSTSIVTLAATYFAGAGGLTLQTNLIGFAVDCSIILALSGSEARDWARGRQRRGRRTKA
ncbi:MAG TPA: LssY C-terminal domain-containing protein [Plantibacter sp.]|uniref:LssY C-terminal domain-containing protein n=1 Tax=unclassified Plantibacter TaxID=2624265 RepID=UPI002BF3748D|nr:LssY C-terminal domain-containing protein [Plantibacter sp.]